MASTVEGRLQEIRMKSILPLLLFLTFSGCVAVEDGNAEYQVCPTLDVRPLAGTPTALQQRFQTPEFWAHLIRHGSNHQLWEMIRYAEAPDFVAKAEYLANARTALRYRAEQNCADVPDSPRI